MDPHQQLRNGLLKIHQLSDEQIAAFNTCVVEKQIGKTAPLLKQGFICNFVAFVLSGSLRSYHAENEQTISFFTENDWVADHDSFIKQIPSLNRIEAMEDTVVAIISIQKMHQLLAADPSFIVLAKLLGTFAKPAQLSVYNTPPQDRYNALMKNHPDWILRFPQKYLASYVGMTPETFSRMKRKVLIS